MVIEEARGNWVLIKRRTMVQLMAFILPCYSKRNLSTSDQDIGAKDLNIEFDAKDLPRQNHSMLLGGTYRTI